MKNVPCRKPRGGWASAAPMSIGPLWNSSHDFVFVRPDGRPMQGSNLNRVFHQALSQAGLPKIGIHDLRHTAATQLLVRGVHPKVVQEEALSLTTLKPNRS